MKKKLYLKLLYLLVLPLLLVNCDGDDEGGGNRNHTDFASIASTYEESAGTGTITIPLRNAGSTAGLDVEFAGSATEGEDYNFVGITSEGVQISIIDDAAFETNEQIRVELVSQNGGGNTIHTVTIVSNCEDTAGMDASIFVGDYEAYERYGPDTADWYGPYTVHFVQDETDPNILTFDNLYDSGCDAFMQFDVAAGSVHFPDQAPCDEPLTNSSGAFTVDLCNDETVLIIDLNFDGGDWVYSFRKL